MTKEKIKDGFAKAGIAVATIYIALIALGLLAFLVGGIAAWCGYAPDWLMNTTGVLVVVGDKLLWIGMIGSACYYVGLIIYDLVRDILSHRNRNSCN